MGGGMGMGGGMAPPAGDAYDKYDKLKQGLKGSERMLGKAVTWAKKKKPHEQGLIAVGCGAVVIFLIWLLMKDHDYLFFIAETIHIVGICILIVKLQKQKSCAGLSLNSQDLTLAFLGIRLYCSLLMEKDLHTLLDLVTLGATCIVAYYMRTKLKASYMAELDNVKTIYILLPCFLLAFVAHPRSNHFWFNRILWAACVFIESVSVLPQLRMIQNTKVVESYTSHYIFCLGIARFCSCAHWILQLFDHKSYLYSSMHTGLWPPMVLLAEVVQTFILADFCFYYVKNLASGGGALRLPSGVV